MGRIRFDFNNMFSFAVGKANGVAESDIAAMSAVIKKAHNHLRSLLSNSRNRVNLDLEWATLPFQKGSAINKIRSLGDEIAAKYENVISLGIGGSYLGLKAAQDALASPYYNEFASARKGKPKIYFEGNNLDPDTLQVLLKNLNPRKTAVVVISKSGETTETKAAFAVVERWLSAGGGSAFGGKKGAGRHYGHQIIAITDPKSGTLRKRVNAEQAKDPLSFRNLPLLKGVGGRYSELNMGLLHLAILGIDLNKILDGAAEMAKRCASPSVFKNPAYMYAVLHTILYRKKAKPIAILMPFSESLKATADWYVQLLAESTGKKYLRKIKTGKNGREIWENDIRHAANVGRTPVPLRGTTDLHSVHQNNAEGENDKVITFIKVEKFKNDITVHGTNDFLTGTKYSRLLAVAEEATEWALVKESRPNCAVVMPEITPHTWGELIFFFQMATAFEGELLNVNAFNQPGVEGYKNYMYYKLNKPGLPKEISEEIKKHLLVKKTKYVM